MHLASPLLVKCATVTLDTSAWVENVQVFIKKYRLIKLLLIFSYLVT